MNHTTLYRKWRPRRFGEIAGQEPVVTTLKRAIETGRVAHAYLFSGPRGTGKTSTAKVLAMGLNCEKGPTPEPDGTCDSCRAITANFSLDVVEMDAASNRGIDEIRDLRDRVNLAPVAGRMKVYIIDEVHMLTPEAFNALLKMLEEPPEHVVFVLATTEKHRVLPTIVSRCQSFDFRRPGVGTLTEKLAEIAGAEGIEVEPAALTAIARGGGGSFRDAEGLLDQLSSFSEGIITAPMVRELLGSAGPEALLETTAALYERRAADALRVVDRLSNEGRDLGQFAAELVSHLRILLLLPYAPEIALSEVGAGERGPLEEQASSVPTAELVRVIDALGDVRGRMRRGGDPKLELELSFLKLTRDYTEPSLDALFSRLETLERALESVKKDLLAVNFTTGERQQHVEPHAEDYSEPEIEGKFKVGEETEAPGAAAPVGRGRVEELSARWGGFMEALKRSRQALTATVFQEGRPVSFDGSVLEIEFPAEADFHAREAGKQRHRDALRDVLEEHLGERPHLQSSVAGSSTGAGEAGAASPGVPSRGALSPDREPPVGGGADGGSPARARGEMGEASGGEGHLGGGAGSPEPAGGTPGVEARARGADDIIRDRQEVFRMARERFGLLDRDRGS